MRRIPVGRAAFIIAAGLLLFVAEPTRAAGASDGDVAPETSAPAGKPLALIKSKQVRASKASRPQKAAKAATRRANHRKAIATRAKSAPESETAIPDAVSNARAEMQTADARGGAEMSGPPPLEAAADEQLTELGHSLTAPVPEQPQIVTQLAANEQPPTAMPAAMPEPPRTPAPASVAASTDAWAQSSLIGKIFIAFGGMLTLASAARMLVA